MTSASLVVVRRSRPSDVQALHDITLAILIAFRLPLDRDLLEYGARGGRTIAELVAEVDGVPIGTITVARHPTARDGGWISKFFVDPEQRGRGAGKALLEAAVNEARRAGFEWIELMTLTVFRDAIRLYEATGWRPRPARKRDGIERRYVLDLAPF
jgi:putative acetyltransferase